MLEILLMLLTLLVPDQNPNRTQVGLGTTFYPKEKGLNNGILGCTGERWVDPDAPYCAMRSRKMCGSWVLIENVENNATTWCKVMDTGPWGKIDANGKWFNAATDRKMAKASGRSRRKGKYRGLIDMSKSVSKVLKSTGMAKVRVKWWRQNPHAPVLDNLLLD